MEFLTIFCTLLILLIIILYIYFKRIFGYWERRNVKFIKPTIPFGNFGPLFCLKKALGVVLEDLYNSTNEPFIGIYGVLRPTLLIRDPTLVHSILISDFNSFTDRGVYIDKENDPISGHLFALSGEEWKHLRGKLTPLFSTVKLRSMIPTAVKCSKILENYMEKIFETDQGLCEIKEITARYTTDIVASVSFGIETNSFANPDNEFRAVGRKMFDLNISNGLRFVSFLVFPALQKFFKIKTYGSEVEKFMISVVTDGFEYRRKHNIIRKDLFQSLMELKDKGFVNDVNEEAENEEINSIDHPVKTSEPIAENDNSNESRKLYTINEIAAQAFVFYAAGYETSSSTTSFCLYEMAKHPQIQYKVQQEIDQVLSQYNNEITYEAIFDMKYLLLCLDETLRLYPPLPILNRLCTKSFKIPNNGYVIEVGTPIMIPVLALHRDPRYYPDPNEFKPERFQSHSDDEKMNFINMPYLPFGEGPKNCIGLRLGIIQSMIALIVLLRKWHFTLADGMKREIHFSPRHYILTPDSLFQLKITKR